MGKPHEDPAWLETRRELVREGIPDPPRGGPAAEVPSARRSPSREEAIVLDRVLPQFEKAAYALPRITTGAMLAMHGTQKLLGWFRTGPAPEIGSRFWVGGVIEAIGGTLIAIGLFTRWAAFFCSGMMAVAYVQFHWKLALDSSFFPLVNHGELALTFALVFLLVACRGPGAASVDARMRPAAP